MKNELAIVGNVVADHILYVDAFPGEGQAQIVSSSRSCGGAALNVARAYHHFSGKKRGFPGISIFVRIHMSSNFKIHRATLALN